MTTLSPVKKQVQRRAFLLARSSVSAAALALATAFGATPSIAQAVKACEDLGGTSPSHQRNICFLTTKPAPFVVAFTGKFEKSEAWPEGPVLKITNKFGKPVTINILQAYVYDKAGTQLEFSLPGSKEKQVTSGFFELEIAPGESKEYLLRVIRKWLPPDMDSLQAEILSWKTPDATFGTLGFTRQIDKAQMAARPKGGWK